MTLRDFSGQVYPSTTEPMVNYHNKYEGKLLTGTLIYRVHATFFNSNQKLS